MTARQGNRACQQAHQGIKPQRRCESDAHGILNHQKPGDRQYKNTDYTPALLQTREIGTQPDGGKKREHQGSLQRGIKSDFNIEQSQAQKTQGNQQASSYRFGDIVSA
ncbi:hypothetical protein D3C72_1966700 [compost metagenome]